MRIQFGAAVLSAMVLANVAFAASPAKQGVVIDDRVYAECTKKILKELGAPPSQAAHFQDMWAAQAYQCAVENSRRNYRIRG